MAAAAASVRLRRKFVNASRFGKFVRIKGSALSHQRSATADRAVFVSERSVGGTPDLTAECEC
ncbi:MAG: hypothetical protein DMG93_20645 [Acidobacteria bacterium]|nr:MAG: hypothetical protein DMG93_20645 [Acidobacteriota bacterium]